MFLSSEEPPSAPRDLQIVTSTDTTVAVIWRRPITTGRDDYFYRVFHSDPDNIGEFILARDNLVDRRTVVIFIVTGLTPSTPYIIRVTTHNGVSENDAKNANSRMVDISGMTAEGGEMCADSHNYCCQLHYSNKPQICCYDSVAEVRI